MSWSGMKIRYSPSTPIKQAGELGLLGAIFPEDLGGAGLGYIDYAIIIEELARVDPSVALIIAAHNSLCTNHIFLAGSEEQKRRYIPKLATGEWIGCWSLTEPEAGSDAAGTRSTAVLQDEHWILNGGKTFTTNAQYADVCVAMCVTDRQASQHGISAFILDKGTPGFRVGKKENKLGMRASATGEVLFTDCRLSSHQLLGKRGEGFVDSLRILDGGRISIAALAVGTAQGAFDAALKYSKQRKQFGRFISEFQAIQHKLADMATSIEAARLLRISQADERSRQARHKRVRDGEVVRVRNGRPSLRRSRANPWRLRVHQRLSGREVLSRCQAVHHWRGHQRNPAHGDRAPVAEGIVW